MSDLPKGWASCTIGEIAQVNPPKPSADALPPQAPVSFVPMPAVNAVRGAIDGATSRRFADVRSGYTAFADHDVLLAKITPCFENGKAAVARDLESGIGFGSSEFFVLRSFGAVLPEYLFHFVRQETFRDEGTAQMAGAVGQARVPLEFVRGSEIPVPPLAEQRRIVEAIEALLEQVNRAKARLERVELILGRLWQSILVSACSGELTQAWRIRHPAARPAIHPPGSTTRSRRGANSSGGQLLLDGMEETPDSWCHVRLDQLNTPGTVITYGIVLPGPEVQGGVPYVRQQDVEHGWVRCDALRHTTHEIAGRHERSMLIEGDVLLCIIRNLRVAVVPAVLKGGNITQGMVRIRPNELLVLRDYLAAYLQSPQAQSWMKRRYFGMDMPRINVEDARAVPVPLPPIEEQQEIVRLLRKARDRHALIVQKAAFGITTAAHLTRALTGRAFTGDLVPTEAELARAEGREYESAEQLLTRIARERAETPTPTRSTRRAAPTSLSGRRSTRSGPSSRRKKR